MVEETTENESFRIHEFSVKTFTEPKFIRSAIAASSMSYGLYCIGACLCMRSGKSLSRSLVVAAPSGLACFAFLYTRPWP